MGKPKAPTPPDPARTAAAQTGANVSTAIANAWMGNINEYTPDGSTTFTQTGTQRVYDPNNKTWMEVPTFTRQTTLSPEQQRIKAQSDQAQFNLAKTASNQSEFLSRYLSRPVNANSLGPRPDVPTLTSNVGNVPTLSNIGSGPRMDGSVSYSNLKTSLGSAPNLVSSYDTEFTADRARTERALMSRMNPRLEQDREALAARLANQGIRAGSAAYEREMQNFGQNVNDARMQAILASGQEQSRLADLARQSASFTNSALQQSFDNRAADTRFGNDARQQMFTNQLAGKSFSNDANQRMYDNMVQAASFNNNVSQQGFNNRLQRADFQNSALMDQYNAESANRAQALQEQFAYRNQPINEITALLSGTQVQQPQFMGANISRIPTTDHAGIIQQDFNNRMGLWQQKMQQSQSLWGGALGFGGALLGLSDRRAKKNIKKVGKADGHNVYSYKYKGDSSGKRHIGVMAQEVEKTRPDVVVERSDGVKVVNYSGLFGKKV